MEDLQQLYRQCQPDIYRYLLLLTRSPAAAEDLTQEVFLTALQKLPAFRGASTPRTWLIGIARNHYRSWRRAQKLHLPLEEAPVQAPAFGPGYEDWQLVLERMNALPETAREVVRLRAAGFSYAEIGEVVGKSEAAARVLFFRAKQMLKEGTDYDE